jgi:hypothetical protein
MEVAQWLISLAGEADLSHVNHASTVPLSAVVSCSGNDRGGSPVEKPPLRLSRFLVSGRCTRR